MKVALVHTRYRQRGGEDAVVDAEAALLRRHGHVVLPLEFDNARFAERGRVAAAAAAVWNRSAVRLVLDTLERERPDVVHIHNTWPAASPAVFEAARDYPLVHTLHNYRWTCLAATLMRRGQVCEDCVGRIPWRGVVHGCYGGDRAASTVLALTLAVHRWRRSLHHVDRFVALTEFARSKLVEAGLPADRIVVRSNFTEPGPPRPRAASTPFVLFVGRLTPEKGVHVLAAAWRENGMPPLEVLGDGPSRAALEGLPGVTLRGSLPPAAVRERMAAATLLVMPTMWFEGMPLVILEAFAAGLPVVGSDLGALRSLIRHGRTGWLVPAGDAAALAATVRRASRDPDLPARSADALRHYRENFTPEVAIASLIDVYRAAGAR